MAAGHAVGCALHAVINALSDTLCSLGWRRFNGIQFLFNNVATPYVVRL